MSSKLTVITIATGGGGRAADEIRHDNLDEALTYLARAFAALDGLPSLVAKQVARRSTRPGSDTR